MAVTMNPPTFFPRRLSQYVPAMQYSADVHLTGDIRISFGAPVTSGSTGLLQATSVAAAGSIQGSAMTSSTITEPFGRGLSIVLSGAGTGTVIIDGWDYLGQPVSENFALNGASAVNGAKAFKTIRQVTWPTVGAVNLTIGLGPRLGLPYKCIRVLTEENNSTPVATLGTLNNPDLTVPATATTGDPRGTYTPTTTPNGTAVITATLLPIADVDANNNGGLHGVPHYAN